MSNGESKIAESKARLCCGFAIALRALFRVILCFFVGDSVPVDCFALLAMTQNNIERAESSAQCVRLKSHLQHFNIIASTTCERGNQPYVKLESWGFYAR